MNGYFLGELDYTSLAQSIILQALQDAFLGPYPHNEQAKDWLTGKTSYAWFEFWCEHAELDPQAVSKRVQIILNNDKLSNDVAGVLKNSLAGELKLFDLS